MTAIGGALAALQIAVQLVVFHTVDGHEVSIARDQVTSLIAAKQDQQNKLYVESVRCVIGLADGKVVTVTESCSEVRRKLEEVAK